MIDVNDHTETEAIPGATQPIDLAKRPQKWLVLRKNISCFHVGYVWALTEAEAYDRAEELYEEREEFIDFTEEDYESENEVTPEPAIWYEDGSDEKHMLARIAAGKTWPDFCSEAAARRQAEREATLAGIADAEATA